MYICLIQTCFIIMIIITIIPTRTHVLYNVRGCLKQDLPALNIYIFGFVIFNLVFAYGSEFRHCFGRCGTPHVYVRRTMLGTLLILMKISRYPCCHTWFVTVRN